MKLLTLTMRNFRQYKDNTLEFGAGLIGIFGANGSGKSTILEAIAWVLYGRLRAGAKNDTVRCRVSEGGSSVYVSLEFELDGEIYKVERSMSGKTNKADASLSVGSIVTATSVKEVNEKIENLFRMDYHAFFTGFFTNQKDIEFMGGKNSTERVTEICKMLGYERIIDARKKANDDYRHAVSTVKALDDIMADPAEIEKEITEKKAALEESQKSLKAAEESYEKAKKALSEAEPKKKSADEAKKTHDKLVSDDNAAAGEEKGLESALKQNEENLKEALSAEEEIKPLIPDGRRYLAAQKIVDALEDAKKRYDESLRLAEGVKAKKTELKERTVRADKLPENEAYLKDAEAVLKKAEIEATEADKALKAAQTEYATLRAEADTKIKTLKTEIIATSKKKDEIVAAGRDGICPTCERPLGDEYEKVVADFETQIKDKTDSINSLRNADYGDVDEKIKAADRVKTAKDKALREASDAVAFAKGEVKIGKEYVKKCTELKAEIERAEKSIKTLAGDFNPAEYNEAEKTVKALRAIYAQGLALRKTANQKAEREKDFKEAVKNLEAVRAKRAGIAKALKDLNFDAEAYEKLTAEHKALSEDVHAAEVAFERAKGDVKAFEVAYKSALDKEKELKENAAKLAEARKESLYLDELRTRFDRFRDDLNSRARPELEDHAAEYLKMMTGERYDTVELDEYYNAVIRYDGEPLQVISGGESDVLNLSLRLGISQMITDRAGHSFSLLVLDEIFGSLDDERKANVVDVLRHLRTRFEQIIIITHVDLVRDAVDCGIQVTFDRESGTSSLKEA